MKFYHLLLGVLLLDIFVTADSCLRKPKQQTIPIVKQENINNEFPEGIIICFGPDETNAYGCSTMHNNRWVPSTKEEMKDFAEKQFGQK